ncbi:VWA domain-containing protein [Winogradskyella aurantiaca]|uniref:VWA domain-containing protein n=1 Tax=Winogradskyella aurantiaca TaxID=2219558 RepID=UPI000E1C6DF5|nr:VWA domain-containing protein [Winogradskyella aurantiaca]
MEQLSWQEQISNIWENLWFLRPEWLYTFIPIGLILVFVIVLQQQKSKWKNNIHPKLLPYLILPGNEKYALIPKISLILFLSIGALGLAGPTWEKIERPGEKTEAVLLVLLDMSNSMLAEDIQPNRLERSKLKLEDFFNAKPKSKIGLVAFAGSAHSVVPFSKDYKTINRQLEALQPEIMPIQGSNLNAALDLADSLLQPIVAPSTILIVTDNIPSSLISRVAQSAVSSHIEVMAISTPGGGVIPYRNRTLRDTEGREVVTQLDIATLDQLSEIENVNSITVTLDNSDVEILAARTRQNLEFEIDKENPEDQWRDFGYFLVFPLLFFSLLSFRRGWKVQWLWLILLSYSCSQNKYLGLSELFFTQDQKAERYLKKGDSIIAAETFKSSDQKGFLYYQMGDLEKAAQAYSDDVSAEGFYNLGVVYYKMGDYVAAQQAFNSALEIDPNMQIASENLDKTATAIEILNANAELGTEKAKDPLRDPEEFQEYTDSPDEKDSAQKSDKTYEGKGDITEMGSKEVDENTIDVFEFDENAVIDKEAAKQTLLRQVTEDPSIFLRRKFAYQVRGKNLKKPKQNW